jgi:hypothetical protein
MFEPSIDFKPCDNIRAKQARAILDYMQTNGQISTIEAREVLGVCHVEAACMTSGDEAIQIQTKRVLEADASGRLHGIALYQCWAVQHELRQTHTHHLNPARNAWEDVQANGFRLGEAHSGPDGCRFV